MAVMATKRKGRKAVSSSKRRTAAQAVIPARRPVSSEAPDRGILAREREAPEVRETRSVEAPDAGYGVAAESESDY